MPGRHMECILKYFSVFDEDILSYEKVLLGSVWMMVEMFGKCLELEIFKLLLHVRRLSRRVCQYAGASLTESSHNEYF